MYSLCLCLLLFASNVSLVFSKNFSDDYFPILYSNKDLSNFNTYLPFILYYGTIFFFIMISMFIKNIFVNFDIKIFSYIVSLYQILFLIFYTLIWLFSCIYIFLFRNDDLLYYQGIWLILNLTSLIYPINRNSIWVNILEFSYKNIKIIHIYISILCIISVIVKIVTVLFYHDIQYLFDIFDKKLNISPLSGTLSSFCIFLTSIFSIPIIRKKIFELFYYSHKILFIVIIIATCMHSFITLFYLIPAIILYLIDIFIRIKNTKKTMLLESKIIGINKDSQYVIFKLRVMNKYNLFPGKYFFINLKDMSRLEWHPLSYIQNTKNCITFFVKDMGKNSWTSKIKNKKEILQNIIIQGPYGNLYKPQVIKKYKHIIFFAGGIGITPLISIIQDIDLKLKNGLYKNIENISIFWSISKLILIECYQELFEELNKNKISLKIYCNQNDLENRFNYNYDIKFKKLEISKTILKIIKKEKIGEIIVLCSGNKNLLRDTRETCYQNNIKCMFEDF
jgi:hypothetical protein